MADLTAEQVLQLINDDEPINLASLELCVIVEGATEAFVGGKFVEVDEPAWWPFQPGEILVVHKASGREVFGEGRKPGKWGVHAEYTDDLAHARRLSAEAKAKDAARSGGSDV